MERTLGLMLMLTLMVGRGSCQGGGSIVRTQVQQVLASLNSPAVNSNALPLTTSASGGVVTNALTVTQPFLTSQSGTFTGMLVRKQTNPGAGGLGLDYCYVDVVNSVAQQSIWESPCQAVTTTNPCVLMLTDDGLQINDGNNEVWNNGADSYQSLVLLENGDLQMLDQSGGNVWQASDEPQVNQNCGTALGPGSLPIVNPPFASPLQANLPNGQPVFAQPLVGANPLVGSATPTAVLTVPWVLAIGLFVLLV